MQGTDGNFYGLTPGGGIASQGTAFKMTPSGTLTILHSFAGGTGDGGYPDGRLVQGTDGNFYGMTQTGGTSGDGIAFKMTPSGVLTVLHNFAGGTGDGASPSGSLVQSSDGNFYGMTYSGGTGSDGILFTMTSGGTLTVLHNFTGNGSDGANPQGSLVQGLDGNFYGMTSNGGSFGNGVIFKQTPASTLAAPVALRSSTTTVAPGGTYTLSYSVANAYVGATNGTNTGSSTLDQCFAINTAGNTIWNGAIAGTSTTTTTSNQTAPATPDSYLFSLTCGGVESNVITLLDYPDPTVAAVSPGSGSTSGGTSVTITGTNFTGATAVRFGSAAAASFTVNSATSITAVSPTSLSPGTIDITVSNPAYTSATGTSDRFTYTQNVSTLTLTASSTRGTYGTAVTQTGTVNNTVATGIVTFTNNGITLGTGTLSAGVATLTSTGLPVGTDSVVATYGGDTGDTSSTSNTVVVIVTAATTAVGSTSAAQEVQFNFTSTVTLNSTLSTAIQAGTQGTANLDFNYAASNDPASCSAGATYTSGQSCTVNFTFSPRAPGQRNGAVELHNSAGSLAATAFVSGIGTAPLVTFPANTTQAAIGGGFSNPLGMAVDPSGNVYVADFGSNSIKKIPSGCTTSSCVVPFKTGLNHPSGVAIDGAGNIIIAGYQSNLVQEVLAPSYTTTVTLGSGFSDPFDVAVDGAGNIFVSDDGNYEIKELTAASGYTTTNILASVGNYVSGLSVDTSGDVFFAENNGKNTVDELVAINGIIPNNSTPTQIGGTFGNPTDAKVDAAGNVFVTSSSNNTVYEILAAGGYTITIPLGNTYNNEQALLLDGSGSVYIADSGNNRIEKLDLHDAPSLTFPSTAVGATSAAQYVALANEGNAALTIASIAPSNANFTFAGAVDGSYAACGSTLASAAICGLGATFTPESASALGANGVVTDNNLNVSGSTQSVALSGTGTIGTKTITFAQPTTPVTAGTSATLTASTSDGDPVTFSITAGTATISGTTTTNGITTATIVYTNTGSVTIAANSAATANATAATAVSRSVTVSSASTAFTPPTTNVGTTSATQTAEVTFTTAGTPAIISVLTQGATGLDYAFVSGGSCSTSTAYTFGQSCSVQYTFTPRFPGNREGSVVLSTSAGGVLGTSYLAGAGTSAEAVIYPGTQTTLLSGFGSDTFGLAIDAANNLYIAQGSNITKETYNAGTYTASTISASLSADGGFAVDGAGNIYNPGGGGVLKQTYNPVSKTYTQSTIYTGGSGLSVTVDSLGNVYDGDGSTLTKLTLTSPGTYTASTISSSFGDINGMATDAAGNIYICDSNNSALYKESYSSGTYTQSTIATGLSNCNGVTVDAAGIVYAVADGTTTAVLRYAPNGSSYTTLPSVGNIARTNGVVLDGSGNLYFTNDSGGDTVVKIAVSTPETLTFASTAVGGTSPAQTAAVDNIGNAALTFSSLTTSSSNFAVDAATTTCSTSTTVAAAGTCNIGAKFTPHSASTLTGTFNVTDNSLNVAGATQAVALTGTGTQGTKSITFAQPATPANLNSTATLTASTSDGDPVVFTITAGTATISGTTTTNGITTATITYTTAGSVTIAANSPATANATAASQVTQSVTVQAFPYVFVANGNGGITSLSTAGAVTSGPVTGGGIGAAVDSSGYVWSINTSGSSVSKFTTSGALSVSYSGTGISGASALAIDGKGVVWIAKSTSISALTNAGAAVSTSGFATAANINAPASISVDTAGSLWLANSGNGTVTEVIGAAAPAATPTVTQVVNNTSGTRP